MVQRASHSGQCCPEKCIDFLRLYLDFPSFHPRGSWTAPQGEGGGSRWEPGLAAVGCVFTGSGARLGRGGPHVHRLLVLERPHRSTAVSVPPRGPPRGLQHAPSPARLCLPEFAQIHVH